MILDIEYNPKLFYAAHKAVIDHLGGVKAIIARGSIYDHELKRGWREVHGAEILGPMGNWRQIVFQSDHEGTLFLLRWS